MALLHLLAYYLFFSIFMISTQPRVWKSSHSIISSSQSVIESSFLADIDTGGCHFLLKNSLIFLE